MRSERKGMRREEWLSVAVMNAKRGNELPQAKLTPAQIRDIRGSWIPYSRTASARALAERHGICKRNVERILAGEIWVHV